MAHLRFLNFAKTTSSGSGLRRGLVLSKRSPSQSPCGVSKRSPFQRPWGCLKTAIVLVLKQRISANCLDLLSCTLFQYFFNTFLFHFPVHVDLDLSLFVKKSSACHCKSRHLYTLVIVCRNYAEKMLKDLHENRHLIEICCFQSL